MKRGIDEVLDAVEDPESRLSVSDLGLVNRVRFNRDKNELYVFTDFKGRIPGCPACAGIASIVVAGMKRDLKDAFERKFPDIEVEIVG